MHGSHPLSKRFLMHTFVQPVLIIFLFLIRVQYLLSSQVNSFYFIEKNVRILSHDKAFCRPSTFAQGGLKYSFSVNTLKHYVSLKVGISHFFCKKRYSRASKPHVIPFVEGSVRSTHMQFSIVQKGTMISSFNHRTIDIQFLAKCVCPMEQ